MKGDTHMTEFLIATILLQSFSLPVRKLELIHSGRSW